VRPAAWVEQAALLPLAHGARVGTSAPRRSEQIRALRADLVVLSLRGNVPTRVERLRAGRYEAIVLAAAGLDRLALDVTDLCVLDLAPEQLVPAPAQGALAVQVRAGDRELIELCRQHLHDAPTAAAIAAERALLARAGGGCNLPLGACVEAVDEHADRGGGWRACAFLGPGHPRAEHRSPRWSTAGGSSPEQAIDRAWAALATGTPTGAGPLGGLRVAIAGSAGSGAELGARLAELGALVTHEVVIACEPRATVELPERVAALRPGDALAVTSRRAARALSGVQVPPGVVVAAVGAATARALEQAGLSVHVVGERGARELAETLVLAGKARVLFPCAADARDDLGEVLRARGTEVERLVIYDTRPAPVRELAARVDVRIYMSPSAVAAAADWERAYPERATLRLGLGRTTAAALRAAGLAAAGDPLDRPGLSAAEVLVQHLARLVAAGDLAA
jgi:porphobilinogen deaminase/uroporphyrinogen-III synthase